MPNTPKENIRNFSIIAHIDHTVLRDVEGQENAVQANLGQMAGGGEE